MFMMLKPFVPNEFTLNFEMFSVPFDLISTTDVVETVVLMFSMECLVLLVFVL